MNRCCTVQPIKRLGKIRDYRFATQLSRPGTCRSCTDTDAVTEDGLCISCLVEDYPALCVPCLLCREAILSGYHVCKVCSEYAQHISKKLGIILCSKKFRIKQLDHSYLGEEREIYHQSTVVDRLPDRKNAEHCHPKHFYPSTCPGFYFGNGVWREPTYSELLSMNRYGILTDLGSNTKGAKIKDRDEQVQEELQM